MHDTTKQQDYRLALLAEQVKYFADHTHWTICIWWDNTIADAIEVFRKSERKNAKDREESGNDKKHVKDDGAGGTKEPRGERSDISAAKKMLLKIPVWAEKLTHLPNSLSTGSKAHFAPVVEKFWETMSGRLAVALEPLRLAPFDVDETLASLFDRTNPEIMEIKRDLMLLRELAAAVAQADGVEANCEFHESLLSFMNAYGQDIAVPPELKKRSTSLRLDDPSLDDLFIDNVGLKELFEWFTGEETTVEAVKEYYIRRPNKKHAPFHATWLDEPTKQATRSHHPALHHLPVVIRWFRTNANVLNVKPEIETLQENLERFSKKDGEVQDKKPRPK